MMQEAQFQALVTAAKRTTGMLGGDHESAVLAIAKLGAAAVEDGIFGRVDWVKRPLELPDETDELVTLLSGRKQAEADQRRVARDWVFDNERALNEMAERIRVCAMNFAGLDRARQAKIDALARVEDDDVRTKLGEDAEALRQVQIVFWLHVKNTWAVSIVDAPEEREALQAWCMKAACPGNPVPAAVRPGAERRRFIPRRGGDPKKAGSLLDNVGDEDDDD